MGVASPQGHAEALAGSPPAMPCEARQDVDMDGSSRLIYDLIKGSRHHWWTVSGCTGAWGREEGGGGDQRPDQASTLDFRAGHTEESGLSFPSHILSSHRPPSQRPRGRPAPPGAVPGASQPGRHTPRPVPPCQALLSPVPGNLWLALLYPSHPLGPELGLSMMQIWASLLCFQMLGPRCHPSNCSAGSSHGGPMASGPPFHSTCVHSLVLGTLTSLQAHRGSGPLHVPLPRPVTPSSSVPH